MQYAHWSEKESIINQQFLIFKKLLEWAERRENKMRLKILFVVGLVIAVLFVGVIKLKSRPSDEMILRLRQKQIRMESMQYLQKNKSHSSGMTSADH